MAETREHRKQPASKPGIAVELVGTTLRQVYDADVAEPLPQAFDDLLRKLL